MSATILPLAGVALGAGGTLLGQRMAVRADFRQAAAERLVAQRTERKEAIIGYLAAAERIEQLRGIAAWTAPAFVEAVTSGKVGAHGIEEGIPR